MFLDDSVGKQMEAVFLHDLNPAAGNYAGAFRPGFRGFFREGLRSRRSALSVATTETEDATARVNNNAMNHK